MKSKGDNGSPCIKPIETPKYSDNCIVPEIVTHGWTSE